MCCVSAVDVVSIVTPPYLHCQQFLGKKLDLHQASDVHVPVSRSLRLGNCHVNFLAAACETEPTHACCHKALNVCVLSSILVHGQCVCCAVFKLTFSPLHLVWCTVLFGLRCLTLVPSDTCLHANYSFIATTLLWFVPVTYDAVSIKTIVLSHYSSSQCQRKPILHHRLDLCSIFPVLSCLVMSLT